MGPLEVTGDPPAGPGTLVVRPESVRLAAAEGPNVVPGRVVQARFHGDRITLAVAVGDTTVEVTVPPSATAAAGQRVRLSIPPDACWVVPPEAVPGA